MSEAHLIAPARLEEYERFSSFLEEQLEQAGVPLPDQMKILTAFEEILVNIIHYAYPDSNGQVEIFVTASDHAVEVTFIDQGMAFDPFSQPVVDTSQPANDRPVGGLGILMVQRLMDQVRYDRIDQRNRLVIRKEIR